VDPDKVWEAFTTGVARFSIPLVILAVGVFNAFYVVVTTTKTFFFNLGFDIGRFFTTILGSKNLETSLVVLFY